VIDTPEERPRDAGALTQISVLVLAAGAGRRLGLGPKAHVALGDETFLDRIVRACRQARLGAVRVVGSPDDPRIAGACCGLDVDLTINPDPSRGMCSSVHAGLERLALASPTGVMVFPVDVPLVRPQTLACLGETLASRPDAWARPVFRGRSGHPVVLGLRVAREIVALGPSLPLREALRRSLAERVDVGCDDPGTVADIDLPEHLQAARRAASA
jgi:CTP:molybdopterin cytidylyltransferase MocA